MARKQATTLPEIADAAARQISRHGLRRTQVADVAREIGISAGTLYLYVENKEALLSLVGRFLIEPEKLNETALPVRAEPRAVLLEKFMETAQEWAKWPRLERAIEERQVDQRTCEEIGIELFDLLAKRRRAVWFMDSIASELEEFAPIHVDQARGRLLADLTALLIATNETGLNRDELAVIARFAQEGLSWSAMHRHREGLIMQPTGDLTEAEIGVLAARAFAGAMSAAAVRPDVHRGSSK